MNALNVFVRLARTIGKDIYLAQAGGGNISFKRDDGSTLIKASGCHLSEVGPSKGWVAADQRAMAKALVSLRSEKDYADFIARFSRGAEKPMSMEAGFHVLIPHRIVLHVHSLAGITLGLLPNAKIKRLIQAAMKDHVEVHIMSPSKPGLELTRHFVTALKNKNLSTERPHLWVLKNHGLIWSGNDERALLAASNTFERYFRVRWHFSRYRRPSVQRNGVVDFSRWPRCSFDFRPLFPDFAVYFNLWGKESDADLHRLAARRLRISGASEKNINDKAEVLFAHALVSTAGSSNGRLPALTPAMIHSIRNMETEKRRMAASIA